MKAKPSKKSLKYILNDIKFDFYTPELIEKISMKPLTSPQVYNNLGLPEIGGLSDPCMGVQAFERNANCEICNQNNENCTGHFCHINLYAPLYNPFMLNQILKLLNIQCFNCHMLKINKKDVLYLFIKIFLIKINLWKEASQIKTIMYESFGENTDDFNKKILMFVNENLNLNKDYFNNLNFENNVNNDSKDDSFENENENIKSKKKNKKENEDLINLEKMQKMIRKEKKKLLKEIFIKIFERQEKIIEKKPKIIYEQNVTTTTLLKEFEKEFWFLSKLNKCSNCGATSKKYKKYNNLKIFQVNISEKERKKMEKSGIDINKNALEHGLSERLKKKKEKIKEKIIKDSENPINEFKQNKKLKKTEISIEEINEYSNIKNNNSSSSDNENDTIENEIKTDITNSKQKFLPVLEVQELLKKLFEKDCGLLKLIYGNLTYDNLSEFKIKIISNAPKFFFIQNLIIPPNRFRPEDSSLGNDSHYLHQQTSQYVKIISLNNDIRELSLKVEESKDKNSNKKTTYFEDLIANWTQMQLLINILFDSSKAISKKEQEGKGIKQMIEKKEGIVRMKIMGKRVNHAGRTVISPDPLIETNEVGVPLFIAGKLYYPEKVTKFNIDYLKKLIINGPYKYPGANQVTLISSNNTLSLNNVKDDYRNVISEKIKFGDIVNRHMQNGDILLLNRQPTLHRPSIMSHKAKILPIEKTFRMHYSNCSSYNADFDGDEMNIHFLQDEISREEGYLISNSNNQYIVPTSGKPIRGLLQDSIDSCVFLTMKDTFFTREEYFQLIYSALEKSLNTKKIRKIILVNPAIIKPKILFTGKQVITTIIKSLATSELIDNIKDAKCTFEHNNKLGNEIWGNGHEDEGKVRLIENELLTGVLDKNEIGASDFGIFHSFYEIFGPELTGEFITVIGKIGVHYLQQFHGFTCSVSDIVFNQKMDFQRRVDIEKILIEGMNSLGKLFDVENFNLDFDNYSRRSIYSTNKEKNKEIIENMKLTPETRKEIKQIIKLQEIKIDSSLFNSYTQKEKKTSYEKIKELRDKYELLILKDPSLDQNVDTVVKNSLNNSTSSYTKTWLSNGLITPFPQNNFTMMVKSGSKGSLANQTLVSCMLGQQELEGRRAPRMTSGKTLPSFEAFDPNPRSSGFITDRFSTGVRPQEFFFHAMAGREGLIDTAVKTSRSGYLQRCLMKHLEQIIVGYDYTVRDCDGNVIQFFYGEDSIDTIHTKFLKNYKFVCDNFDTYVKKMKPERIVDVIDTKKVKNAIKNGEITNEETLLNKFEPWKFLGSVSEKVYESMHDYIIKDPDNKFKKKDEKKKNNIHNNEKKISRSEFKNLIFLKYLNSLIQPGESVGVLAAQSIGEPSTQMTLNTFHLAGNGGVNVTLGIPRLREILMTSEKNIKTPIMTLPMKSKDINDAKKLSRVFEEYKLIDVIKNIKMKQSIKFRENNNIQEKFRCYEVEIYLESVNDIKEYFDYTKNDIIFILKNQFIPLLAKQISRYLKMGNLKMEISVNNIKDDNIENDEETNTEKYSTKKRKNDEDEIGEEEELEDESEQEKTYDDTFIKATSSEDEEEEIKDNNIIEEENNTNKTNTKETEESISQISENENNENNENEENKNKKKPKKDFLKDTISKTHFSYKDIQIEKMNFKSKETESQFSFTLLLPYVQKNILLKNILDIILKKLNFKSIKNIKKTHILEKENKKGEKEYIIQLEGFNYEEIIKYSNLIHINKIGTNDIGSILKIYGIEACRSAIVKEIVNVFDVYSIKVNKRHLGLIADYITFQGKYRSFSRKGISFNSSTVLKMSYETTMEFLIEACQGIYVDNAITPSARIFIGRTPICGTGAFDVVLK